MISRAKASLEKDPTDPTGTLRRTILVGLIKTKAFEEALQFIKSQKDQNYLFEHVYILHRMGQNSQALKVLDEVGWVGPKDSNYLQLRAQVLYKLGEY